MMMDQTSSGITENPGTSDFPVVLELKAMFADLLEGAKRLLCLMCKNP